MAKDSKAITNYQEFWFFYLSEHSSLANRLMHYIGSALALVCLLLFIFSFQWHWLILAFSLGYLFAWVGHFFIEKNKPASFKYPLWSFISDWRMFFLMLLGKLDNDLKKVSASS